MPTVRCVGAVVLDADGRLLVVLRRNEPAAGRWSVPGGRVEAGEDDRTAVRREVREETGLDVAVGRHLGSVDIDAGGGTVYDVHDYLCTAAPGTDAVAGDDATAVRWVDHDAFVALDLVDGLRDALDRWDALPR